MGTHVGPLRVEDLVGEKGMMGGLKGMQEQALTGVAQWISASSPKQKVIISTPGQGTCLGCGPGPLRTKYRLSTDWRSP